MSTLHKLLQGRIQDFFYEGVHSSLALLQHQQNHIVFFFLQNTSCIRKPQVISGGSHPLHPPLRSAPVLRSLPSPNIDLSAGSWKTRFKKNPILLTLRYRQLLLVSPPSYRPMYPLNKNLGFWETAHLLLPWDNINTYFSLRAKCWLKGGVGGQFPKKKT